MNDYRLQLYDAGSTKWSYLASTKLGNLQYGTNTFAAVAINRNGLRSEPAVLTIILGKGEEGVINETDQEETAGAEENTPVIDGNLPNNTPLAPGTLTVDIPTPGTTHTETGTGEVLIQGTPPTDTFTLWVNDYRLRLFEPGRGMWNYRASTELKTLKQGSNTYEIIARNRKGEILDRMVYTIELNLE